MSVRDQFTAALHAALRPRCDLVVDCAGIEFIDANGIGVLVGAARALDGHQLRLVNVHGVLAFIIDLLDLATTLPNLTVHRRNGIPVPR